jgi:cobalt-zinc-cadmium efflux system protein
VSGGHDHSHGVPTGGDHRRRLALVLMITAIVLVVEVVGVILSGSLALLADAGHMLTDVALVIALTGWERADAVVSLLIATLIVPRTIKLLRETVSVLLETTPPGLDLDNVRAQLVALPHVIDVHDLHASQITAGQPVLTAHVIVEDSCFQDGHAPQILDQL